MTQATKVEMINAAVLNSALAIRKGAKAEVRDGKVVYTCDGQKTKGTYRMRITLKEILFMLDGSDIKKIISQLKAA